MIRIEIQNNDFSDIYQMSLEEFNLFITNKFDFQTYTYDTIERLNLIVELYCNFNNYNIEKNVELVQNKYKVRNKVFEKPSELIRSFKITTKDKFLEFSFKTPI